MTSNVNNNNIVQMTEDQRCENAHKVAEIMKNSGFPALAPCSGINRYFRCIEEAERRRLLANPEEMNSARVLGKSVAQLFKAVPFPYFKYQWSHCAGLWKYVAFLEEKERQRRIADKEEAVCRRMNALHASEYIRTERDIIRARFVKRNLKITAIARSISAWESLSHAAHIASSAAHMASSAAHMASTTTGNVLHSAIDAATPAVAGVYSSAWSMAEQAAHTASETIHSEKSKSAIAAILSKAYAIKDSLFSTVQRVLSTRQEAEEIPDYSDFSEQEEQERERRIEEDPIDGCARSNARKMSHIIAHAKFPTLHSLNTGFKKFTWAVEEHERMRRLANKSECEIHRLNANRIAALINQLGWPFIKHPAGSRSFSQAGILEDEEQRRRMTNEKDMWISRHNAKIVSALIKEANFQVHSKRAFLQRHFKNLEEKERKYRMKNKDFAIHNAHREAQLIANIGAPFFISQARRDAKEIVRQKIERMETEERLDRIHDVEQQAIAKKQARKAAKMVSRQASCEQWPKNKLNILMAQEYAQDVANIINSDINLLQEQERKARMEDKLWAQQARNNARKVSGLIKKHMTKDSNSGFGITANNSCPVSALPPATISPRCVPLAPCVRGEQSTSVQAAPVETKWVPVQPSVKQTRFNSQSLRVPAARNVESYPPRYGLKKSTDAMANPEKKEKLIAVVTQQYKAELKLADIEQDKVSALSNKPHGPWWKSRLHRHQAAANKHRDNAKRHQDWLMANKPPVMSAL